MSATTEGRSASLRKWLVCALLLAATAVNYMDRGTLALAAKRIQVELEINNQEYGNLEWAFGWAFAGGSLLFGFLADRVPVAVLYPAVLLLWSAAGFATGLAGTYGELIACRALLGLFEAGHWPCALKTTQRLLEPGDRVLGNGVLQSGAAVGSIVTPFIMKWFLTPERGSWRAPFLLIGAAGLLWIIAWLWTARGDRGPASESGADRSAGDPQGGEPLTAAFTFRRLLVLAVVLSAINTSWQLLRAWLPKFLQEGRGYSEAEAFGFMSLYYSAAFAGCLGAGALTLKLQRRGLSIHASRCLTFLIFALLMALTNAAALLPRGWPLLLALLLAGAGALGLFPIYYSLSQELSTRHMGKITGLISVIAWGCSPAQSLFGRVVDRTGSYDAGLAITGSSALIALAVLWGLWRR
jgi:MFS transporter, ACS family, aldohexuronate transporter